LLTLAGGEGGGGPAWKDRSGEHKAVVIDVVGNRPLAPQTTGKWLCMHVLTVKKMDYSKSF